MNKVQEQIKRTRGIVGLIIEAAGPQEEWMPIDAKIAEITLETADTMESMQARIELLEKENERLKKQLQPERAFEQEPQIDDSRTGLLAQRKRLLKRQELLEKVVEAGKYLSAEVRNAWAFGRISIDTHDAAGLFDNSIAALKE